MLLFAFVERFGVSRMQDVLAKIAILEYVLMLVKKRLALLAPSRKFAKLIIQYKHKIL